MTERLQVYRCELCGNTVQVFNAGAGELVCCGQPMTLQNEKTADAATEKHVPVVVKIAGGYQVTVGSVPHPMTEDHQIVWIEIIADGAVYRRYLEPGDAPTATFKIDADTVSAREYCNLHGHWKA